MAEQTNLPTGESNQEMDMEYLLTQRDKTIDRLVEVLKDMRAEDKHAKAKREQELFKVVLKQNRQIDLFIEQNKP